MIIKKCSHCKTEKTVDSFHKDKTTPTGYSYICKCCKKNYTSSLVLTKAKYNKLSAKKYYEKNKTIILKKQNEKKEQKKVYDKSYQKLNSEKISEYSKTYKEKNKEQIKYVNNKYKQNNKHKIKEIQLKYRQNNPHIFAWRSVLTNSLKRLNRVKENHTIQELGYSALDLKKHITSLFTPLMTWDNYGEWHIDHIKMLCEFDKNESTLIVNALHNLRPMWSTTREIDGVIYQGNLNRNLSYSSS